MSTEERKPNVSLTYIPTASTEVNSENDSQIPIDDEKEKLFLYTDSGPDIPVMEITRDNEEVDLTSLVDDNCRESEDGSHDETKRIGNNKAHRSKTKRRAIAAMVKKSKRRNRK